MDISALENSLTIYEKVTHMLINMQILYDIVIPLLSIYIRIRKACKDFDMDVQRSFTGNRQKMGNNSNIHQHMPG